MKFTLQPKSATEIGRWPVSEFWEIKYTEEQAGELTKQED